MHTTKISIKLCGIALIKPLNTNNNKSFIWNCVTKNGNKKSIGEEHERDYDDDMEVHDICSHYKK